MYTICNDISGADSSDWLVLKSKNAGKIHQGSEVLLPSSDQEEKGEDDEESEATHRCCDDDQHLALVRGNV